MSGRHPGWQYKYHTSNTWFIWNWLFRYVDYILCILPQILLRLVCVCVFSLPSLDTLCGRWFCYFYNHCCHGPNWLLRWNSITQTECPRCLQGRYFSSSWIPLSAHSGMGKTSLARVTGTEKPRPVLYGFWYPLGCPTLWLIVYGWRALRLHVWLTGNWGPVCNIRDMLHCWFWSGKSTLEWWEYKWDTNLSFLSCI